MSDTVTGYFWGYEGQWLTKEEYEQRLAEYLSTEEERKKWEAENPDFEYDW